MKTPFRLGTTSFIYRDHVLPNVQRLADRVDDVQILFFDIDRRDELPSAADLDALAAIKQRHDLTYTLHTPLDVVLGSANEAARRASVNKVLDACELAAPLRPERVVVHVEREADAAEKWRERAERSFEAMLEQGQRRGLDLQPATLCVENLNYDFALIEPVVSRLGLSVAADIGHLLRDGRELTPMLDRHLQSMRIIHWHGVDAGGRDHRSLAHYPPRLAQELISRLIASGYDGVLTLEVFSEADFEESMQVFGNLLGECEAAADCAATGGGR